MAHTETLVRLYCDQVAARSTQAALYIPAGDGQFRSISWQTLAADVRQTARLLRQLGVEPGDRVVQVSENRYEWILLDLAIHLVRGVHVAIHAALSPAQIAVQIADCGARLAFVEKSSVISAPGAPPGVVGGVQYIQIDSLLQPSAFGLQPSDDTDLESAALFDTRPDDLATILYTSGTTGEPKGVMLSHRNLASNALATIAAFDVAEDDLRLCWLPLSHIFARTCDLYTWLASGAPLALAESRERIIANCQTLRPTMLNGVPYFFDKVRRHLEEKGTGVFSAAEKTPVPFSSSLAQLFGGRMRLCCSGGAALPDDTAEFYWARGVKLTQGYGLTESSPVITLSTPTQYKLGTVGRAIAGVEVAIAADGEILTRGPHVMLGYWGEEQGTGVFSAAEKTPVPFSSIRDGWLHTGDLGQLDEEGFLRITGRKKELIVTAGGKNVAPVLLENLLLASPLVEQALVLGDDRNYLAALIVPNPTALREAIIAGGIPVRTVAEALVHPDVLALYRQEIDARLCDLSSHEQIGRFLLLDRGFSFELGELTPTLKLRRATIAAHFAAEIERLYE